MSQAVRDQARIKARRGVPAFLLVRAAAADHLQQLGGKTGMVMVAVVKVRAWRLCPPKDSPFVINAPSSGAPSTSHSLSHPVRHSGIRTFSRGVVRNKTRSGDWR